MSCERWEELIALDRDATAEEREAAGRHAAGCDACREFADGMRRSLEALGELGTEALPAEALAAVRARVLSEIEPRPRRRWTWCLAAAAVLLAVLGGFLAPEGKRLPPAAGSAKAPQEAPPLAVSAGPPPVPKPKAVKPRPAVAFHRAPPRPETPAAEPLLVKLVTDDPDVVIYWIVESKGATE